MGLNLMTLSAHVLEHSVGLLMSIQRGFMLLLPFSGTLGYLFLYGIVALFLRRMLLWAAPFLARNAGTITTIINIVFEVLDVVVAGIRDMVNLILDVLLKAIKLVPFFPKFKPSGFMGDGIFAFTELDATQVKRTLNEIQHECPAYNSIPAISRHITRQTLNEYVCPIIRATKPLGWVGDATEAMFSPFSYDATPFPGDMPKPGGAPHVKEINCRGPENQDVTWACVVLGVGYVVIEVLIPAMIIGIFLFAMGRSLLRLLGDVLSVVAWVLTLAFHLLMLVLSEI